MNNHRALILSIIVLTFATACSTSSIFTDNSTEAETDVNTIDTNPSYMGNEVQQLDYAVDLTTHLLKIPGLNVRGTGANAAISIRGAEGNTFYGGSSEPLFILNGMQVGDYSQVYNMISSDDVLNIRVLKGSDAAEYGARGFNGVIIIKLK